MSAPSPINLPKRRTKRKCLSAKPRDSEQGDLPAGVGLTDLGAVSGSAVRVVGPGWVDEGEKAQHADF